jgi:hypothetical protein
MHVRKSTGFVRLFTGFLLTAIQPQLDFQVAGWFAIKLFEPLNI